MEIKRVTQRQLTQLQAVSRATFADTFGAQNTAENLAEYLDEAYGDQQLTSELENPATTFWFALVAGQVAGYLKLNVGAAQSETRGDAALEVERIYILPAFKRQGIGTQLIQFAEQRARQQTKQKMWLGVWEHNPAAIAFYKRMGFEAVDDHVFKLGDDEQRDVIMEKQL